MSAITKEFTKEQLQQIIETDHVQCGEASALARIALASLEAEAVAYIFKHPAGRLFWSLTDESNKGQSDVMPVYIAPPAPASVPDEMTPEMMRAVQLNSELGSYAAANLSGAYGLFAEFWKVAHRAAVLQGAEPVSNRDELPDGWVACSERMPNIGVPVSVPVITSCGDVVHCAVYVWDGKEWQDWYEEYDKLPFSTFTHWMPLPAAPQQEVK